jgi:hypothetical protein
MIDSHNERIAKKQSGALTLMLGKESTEAPLATGHLPTIRILSVIAVLLPLLHAMKENPNARRSILPVLSSLHSLN